MTIPEELIDEFKDSRLLSWKKEVLKLRKDQNPESNQPKQISEVDIRRELYKSPSLELHKLRDQAILEDDEYELSEED